MDYNNSMLRMIIRCKIRLTARTKIYKLHRRIYDPIKYLCRNVFAKLPISGRNRKLIS